MPTGQARFTEEELALILSRAAEMQEGTARPSGPRYSLAEIQAIATEAGISADHVAAVAASLRTQRDQSPNPILGAPWKFRFEEAIDGEVADEVVGELLDIARRELGLQGTVAEALGAVEWTGRDTFGSTHVSVTRRGGRTSISVLSARSDSAAVAGALGGTGALLGSILAGSVLVATGWLAAPAAAFLGVVGATGGSWFSMRTTWRHFARRYSDHTQALSTMMIDAARQAVLEGRIRT